MGRSAPGSDRNVMSTRSWTGDLKNLLLSVAPLDHMCSSTMFSNGAARNASPPRREDDKDCRYVFAVGENLTPRYKIYCKMGEGMFGLVLECWDKETKEMVAVKIVRGVNKYREAAMIEIDVLQQLKQHDNAISRLEAREHFFVSPEYIKVSDNKVGSRSIRLPKSNAIKVIDFGSTTYDNIQDHNYVVSTRHYRAPEVILVITESPVIAESSSKEISGSALFTVIFSRDEKYFRRGRLHWPEGASSRESIKAVSKLARLQNLVMQHVDHSAAYLIDLLKVLLNYDPTRGLTAHEALRHPSFLGIT